MRPIILGLFAILAAAHDASAAPYTQPPEVAAPVATHNWTGIYAGVVGGWNRSRARGDWNAQSEMLDPPVGLSIGSQMETGFRSMGDGVLFGGSVGANLQRGRFVVGVEGDLAWTDKSGRGRDGFTNFATIAQPPDPTVETSAPGVQSHRWDMNWLGTVRLRAGVTPVDRLLIFGTFGLAVAGIDLKTSAKIDNQTLTSAKDDTYYGWTAGAGVEYALTSLIRLKADWLYYDLGSKSFRTSGVVHVNEVPADFEVNQRTKLDLTGQKLRGSVIIAF